MKRLVLSTPLVVLLGCGGGGSGSSVSFTSNPNPPVQSLNLEGPWTGNLQSYSGGSVTATALVLASGEMRYVASNGIQAVGNLSVSGTTFTGSGTMYAPTGSVFLGGGTTASFVLSGTGTSGTTMTGTYSSLVDNGTMSFTYNTQALYSTPVVMSNVAGSYLSVSTSSGYSTTGTLTAAGAFSGSDGHGTFTGTLSAVDATKNAFRVTINYLPTGQIAQAYSGLGFFNFGVTPPHLVIQATGTTGQFAAEFARTGP
ncbi:hypothetical protein GETHLI_08250 [Geothrix limicola]|uniref:Lipoprotein n=1 Tax=Geothrix limicola TaxID=2927978 RepID=A0ABQ5QCC9_9BACT|nr:hypothetical protein [Geothrix limicola]GLH72323.1 hypothetical protein GETHLI_08250 [Geothrix limicola]